MSKGNQATTPGGARAKSVNQDAIAKRAYELFLQRGSVAGHEVDDWLQAEAELIHGADDVRHAAPAVEDFDDDRLVTGPATHTPPGVEPTKRPATGDRSGGSRRGARQPTSH